MYWLTKNFGGKVIERRVRETDLGKKIRYEWRPASDLAYRIAKETMPFLKVKGERAKILLQIKETVSLKYRGTGVPDEVNRKRETLYIGLRSLNNTQHTIESLQPQRLTEDAPNT